MCRSSVCKKCNNVFESEVRPGPPRHCCPSCRQSVCQHCGESFERTPRSDASFDALKYCKPECYFAAIKAGTQQFIGVVRNISWQLACWAEDWAGQCPESSQCRWCGKESRGNMYCSDVCSSRWHHFSKKPSECVKCGKSLNGLMYQTRSMCADCRKKQRHQAKKELQKKYSFLKKVRNKCNHYGVAYDSAIKAYLVFERDGFRCQICKAACLKKFRWVGGMPHFLSPTVDHIVPLSWRRLGHTWDNVQCACWSCNVKKNNKRGGQVRFAFSVTGAAE